MVEQVSIAAFFMEKPYFTYCLYAACQPFKHTASGHFWSAG